MSMWVWLHKSEKKQHFFLVEYWVEGIVNKRNLDNIIERNNNNCVLPYTVIFSEAVVVL